MTDINSIRYEYYKNGVLGYNDVYLLPGYSELDSRSQADTTIKFGNRIFKLPITPSNMGTVINEQWAKWLSANDYFYVMHRFDKCTLPFVRKANIERWKTISISTGVNEDTLEELIDISKRGLTVDYVTIDVAHGHHRKVKERIKWVKELLPDAFIIAGNTATAEATLALEEWGADATKCLIGTGAACSTKYQTGFHVPAFSCLKECSSVAQKPVIADGGAQHYGDIAKALVAGASMVMSGHFFASCSDSPAPEVNGKKVYFGNASAAAKGQRKHVEGFELQIENSNLSLEERLNEIKEALQSSISYAGGKDLNCFNGVKYVTTK
jgi:GMP reductase